MISPSIVAENTQSSDTSHSTDGTITLPTGILCPVAPPLQKMVRRTQTVSLKPKKPFSMATTTPTSVLVEPSCHSQSIKDVYWRRAMSEEYNALIQNGTWELVQPSTSQNIVGYKWVFKMKLKSYGSLDHY